ncbi:MAG: AMP-binding protein [Candidatus Margulisiibacteriota bacterium]
MNKPILVVPEMLKMDEKKFSPHPALKIRQENDSYKVFTYKEFVEALTRVSAFLAGRGVRKNDKVVLLCENRPEWPIVYFGIANIGAVTVPLDPKLEPEEIRNLVVNSDSTMLFSSSTLMEKVDAIRNEIGNIKDIVNIDGALQDVLNKPADKVFLSNAQNMAKEVVPQDLLSIIYTSGTTGNPKGVMLTHMNILSNVAMIDPIFWMLGPGDNFLSVLPNYHTFETTAGMFCALFKGCCITYAESLKSYNLLRNMQETRTSVLCAVPLLYKLFAEGIDRQIQEKGFFAGILFGILTGLAKLFRMIFRRNFGRLFFGMIHRKFGGNIRFFVSGGAALDPELIKKFDLMGFTILQGYGLTETSPILSACTLDNNVFGSVGKALPGIEIKINDPSKDGIGEIIARGSNIMIGYYKNEEATKEVIRDGWFHTGDLGRFDKNGNLYITGRCKDVIVLGSGVNVYPDEAEFTLSKSPFISEVCVFGHLIKDGVRSGMEEVHCAAVPNMEYFADWAMKNGQKLSDELINGTIGKEIDRLSLNLTNYKRPAKCYVSGEPLPKTTTKKIKRAVVKKNYCEEK